MKAITIKNPWSYLIAIGLKNVENRSWRTNFRGKVLIHVSKPKNFKINLTDEQMKIAMIPLTDKATSKNGFETGAIIGEVDIVDCIRTSNSIWAESGQWHWILQNARMYQEPILNVKGKLSFWEYTNPVMHCHIPENASSETKQMLNKLVNKAYLTK